MSCKTRWWLLAAIVLVLASAKTSEAQSIGDDWNNDTIRDKYNIEPWTGFWCVVEAVADQCGIGDVMIDVLDDLPNDVATRLATECRQENPCDFFKQISCASQKVNAYYAANGGQADRCGSSPCRSQARAVEEVVAALGIPGTEIGLTGWTGTRPKSDGTTQNVAHVVNRVTIQWNGNVYVYVLDAGWFPGVFFPYTEWTQQYHKDHGRTAPRMIPFRPDCMDSDADQGEGELERGRWDGWDPDVGELQWRQLVLLRRLADELLARLPGRVRGDAAALPPRAGLDDPGHDQHREHAERRSQDYLGRGREHPRAGRLHRAVSEQLRLPGLPGWFLVGLRRHEFRGVRVRRSGSLSQGKGSQSCCQTSFAPSSVRAPEPSSHSCATGTVPEDRGEREDGPRVPRLSGAAVAGEWAIGEGRMLGAVEDEFVAQTAVEHRIHRPA